MAAVVRVKRLLEEEPSQVLVINCKRRKTTDPNDEEDEKLSTVLKFAGTIEDQSEDIFKHINKPTKAEAEDNYKKHNIDIITKLREETQIASKENRYKVINYYRTSTASNLDDESKSSSETDEDFTVVDVELNKKEAEDDRSSDLRYVYDLYYTTSDDLGDADFNEFISVYPLSDELVYGSRGDNGFDDADSFDSEDSNAETNWRNDYPDESDVESVTEEDMARAVRRCTLDDESDLSGDSYDERLVYGDSDDACLEEHLDESDVRQYGRRYARFKAKAKRLQEPQRLDGNIYFGDIDEEYDD